MKSVSTIAFAMLALAVALPRSAPAVSFSPVPEENEAKAARGGRGRGEMVCLFQSGTEEIRKAIAIGDMLSVYRQGADGALREVGKIKVLSYEGEDYLKGKVVRGQVKTGDVAKKGDIASLVISSDEKCKGPGQ